MSGRSTAVLTTTALALASNICLNLLLIPELGGAGAALATSISILLVNVLNSVMIWKLDRFSTYSWFLFFTTAAVSGTLLAQAFSLMRGPFLPVTVALILSICVFRERRQLRSVLAGIRPRERM